MYKYLAYCVTLLWVFSSCQSDKSSSASDSSYDARFSQYVSAFTSGTVSRRDNVRIRFDEGVTVPDDLMVEELLKVSPGIEGTLVKTDPHEVTFSPDKELQSGQTYAFELQLGHLAEVPDELSVFEFSIQVIKQDFDVSLLPVEVPDPSQPDQLTVSGQISLADYADNESIESMISLPSGLSMSWQHASTTDHRFDITGIKRSESISTLSVEVSGQPIDVNRNSTLTVEVPSTQLFSVLSTRVNISSNPFVSVFFTDPLDDDQALEGLVQIEGVTSPSLVVKGNELQIYVPNNLSGTRKLEISEGVRNAQGKTLATNTINYIAFEPEKPQVRLTSAGTILPSTDGLVLPFEAVNLKAVRVSVVRVFADNLPQFFQVNDYSGSDELLRVGQKVIERRIQLEGQASDLSTWNRFTLELSSLFEAEMGALYQVQIGFLPQDSNYPCDDLPESSELTDDADWSIYDDDGFNQWGSPWGYSYPQGYDWQERDNPCHVSYYRTNRFALTSLMASDIGLIAKIGADNSLSIITTDMKTAQPVPASIQVLDFQLQELATANADATGMVSLMPDRRPFLVIAEHQGQSAYLRLNDNSSLSMSNFDVSGTRVKGGLKGFIYGERGVWRPGDDIYLSFMLEDAADKIPANHPVTMELRDPRGTVQDKQVLSNGVNGLYTFLTRTAPDAVTGNWQAKVKVGNNQFNKRVKIETIKPNRLKINLEMGEERIAYTDRNLTGRMQVNWLTGLKGSNLDVETELRLSEANTTFDGFGQYEFDDQGKSFYESPKVVYTGQLDEEGTTNLEVQLPSKPESPGAIRATFNTKAFEPGGGFSINAKSYTYFPYETFVGINLTSAENGSRIKRDEPQNLAVVTVNADGELVSKSGLDFKVYRLNWRWWWDESSDNTTNYISSGYATLVKSEKFDTEGGKANLNFEISSPSWGRFIAVVKDPVSGHSASQVFYTSWYGGEEGSSLGATSLEVSTDKSEYAVGETIKVMMRGSLEGNALVSIENGSKVLENFWVKTEKEWTSLEIPAAAAMAPNVYLHVTLLQPHGQTVNDLPIRLYGIAPIKVFDPISKLNPVIAMQDKIEPGELVEFEVSEDNDQPMSYTIAIVDEGLLDITNFTTPEPWDHFYSKEAIGVKTWDLYDDVIGAYGGRLERLLAVGGGEGGLQDGDKMQENRFKPVVKFMGPYYLAPGETADHSYVMPEYIGSVKTMLVAGLDQTYGSADITTPVVKPLMVQGTMPRVVGPGERVSLPVNVFRYVDQIESAEIEVVVDGVLKLSGEGKQSIQLDKESGTLYFDLEVAERIGKGQITISGRSGRETAEHKINIVSRAPNTPQTVVKVVQIDKGESEELDIDLFGMEGTNEVSLEVASIPSINIEQRLNYLMRYPHGCIEQTVSAVFPQLFLGQVTELTSEQRVKTESNIQAAIKRLTRFQTSGGGMSYWPGSSYANSWGSSYAYHFLIEAQKMGYAVPSDLVNGLRKFQKSKASQWIKSTDHWDSDLIQSYRLFTLAIAGYPELGAMNRLRSSSGNSYESLCKLAAAYAAIGRKDAARALISSSDKKLLKRSYNYYFYSYGSYHRDLAILLETYVYLEDNEEAFKVIQQLSDQLSGGEWMSTQETAYSLLAIGKYVASTDANSPLQADIGYGSTSTSWQAEKAIYRSAIDVADGDKLNIANKGEATLFATLTVSGTPKPGAEIVDQSDLGIKMRYVTSAGRPLEIDSLPMGESFDVLVTVSNEYQYGQVRDIALSHILPSGWEIQNDRLNDQVTDEYDTYDYQDVRDDRVYTYFHLRQKESKTFKISATAAYPGKYYLPGPYAEAMYKGSIHAKDAGKWVIVYE